MDNFYDVLKRIIADHQPNFGDGDSVLSLLYEAYSDFNRLDDDQIKADFEEIYRCMNGMTLKEMDRVIYAVCTLCRHHEKAGFVEGIKIGLRLNLEINLQI